MMSQRATGEKETLILSSCGKTTTPTKHTHGLAGLKVIAQKKMEGRRRNSPNTEIRVLPLLAIMLKCVSYFCCKSGGFGQT